VENASGDDSARRIRAWADGNGIGSGESERDWLVLLEASENHGYAAGNNIGLAWIKAAGEASHVWLLNPDTSVTPSALPRMLDRMAADPGIGTCGALLCEMDEPDVVQCYGGAGFRRWTARPFDLGKGERTGQPVDAPTIERQLGYVMGACLLATADFLKAAGPMDERFFLYFEEIAWQRAAGPGFRPGFAPEATVYHRRHASGGRNERYLFANRLRFARWYQPWSVPFVALGLLGTAAAALSRRDWRRARLLLSSGFWRFALFG
jgi:GT2 family glycosyltransferase